MVCYAVNVLPIKDNLYIVLKLKPSQTKNLLFTFVVVSITSTCSWAYPEITDWLGFIGSLSGVFLSFFFPSITFYIAYRNDKGFGLKTKIALVFGVVMSLIGLTSCALLILSKTGVIDL